MWYVELQGNKGRYFTVSCPLDTYEDALEWIVEWVLVEVEAGHAHDDVFRVTNR